MSLALTATKSAALIPMLTSSLAQLQPVMIQTQESIQGLVVKVTDALASSEERGRKLEEELIAAKTQHATDKVASQAREKAQAQLIDTLQNTVATLQKEVTILIEREKTVEKTLEFFIKQYNCHQHGLPYHVNGGQPTGGPGYRTSWHPHHPKSVSFEVPEPKFDDKKAS